MDITQKALEQYYKHLERTRKYNLAHKETVNERAKTYFKEKIKGDPEKYELYKAEKRRQYHAKKELAKKATESPTV
jgi:hypothetical protein